MKRGNNVEFIVLFIVLYCKKKLQGATGKVEEWSFTWGFKFSVDKIKTCFFTRKRIGEDVKLRLYGQERVSKFKFLGL